MPVKPTAPQPLMITIDGPAGAGKTTVSKMLAQRLGYRYIDTGALYRGIAVAVQDAGIAAHDDQALWELCGKTHIDIQRRDDEMRLLINQLDVTDRLRSPEITMLASAVSARPVVRNYLLEIQRMLGGAKQAVVEGRDMGTVVFPDADLKFILVSDARVRAERRHRELQEKSDTAPSLETVEQDMAKRDKNDSTRQVAPLKPAPDAIQIDSTPMTIEQVVEVMLTHVHARQTGPA